MRRGLRVVAGGCRSRVAAAVDVDVAIAVRATVVVVVVVVVVVTAVIVGGRWGEGVMSVIVGIGIGGTVDGGRHHSCLGCSHRY